MKLTDILAQLMSQIGNQTTQLTTTFQATSVTWASGKVTVVTQAPHGLVNNQNVFISGAVTPVVVSSLTFLNGVATGVTATPHDLTETWQGCMGTPAAYVVGATQAPYNINFIKGWKSPDRNTFTYPVIGSPTSPATGTILLNDGASRGVNGLQVVTVVNATTFTFPLTGPIYATILGTVVVHTKWNIGKAATLDRFMEVYSKQPTNTPWLCIVMGASSASSDRELQNDAVAMYATGTLYRQKIVDRCSIYIVIPSTAEIAGANARDQVEDLKQAIFSSILGVKFPSYTQLPQEYGLVFNSGDLQEYDRAYLIYEMKFEQLSQLTQADVAPNNQLNVAFRDVILQFQNQNNSVIMTTDANLDDDAGLP